MTQPIAFVLAATDHGPMIVNRFDFHATGQNEGYGVGAQLLTTSVYRHHEVKLVLDILLARRKHYGKGVLALDCGANIGVHTITWSKLMTGWGSVIAVEPQERIYYALVGNIALNNCFNARAILAAVSSENGTIGVPVLDYQTPSSFGSLELRKHPENEFIGQAPDYNKTTPVPTIAIDEMNLPRVDFIKLDIQRMELEALEGAKYVIKHEQPVMLIEKVDVGADTIRKWFSEYDYAIIDVDIENVIAVHNGDAIAGDIKWTG